MPKLERWHDEVEIVQELERICALGCIDNSNPAHPSLWRRCHLYPDHSTFSDGNSKGAPAPGSDGNSKGAPAPGSDGNPKGAPAPGSDGNPKGASALGSYGNPNAYGPSSRNSQSESYSRHHGQT